MAEWNELQLRFDLDLDEISEDSAERMISPMEARQISEAARMAFDQLRAQTSSFRQGWWDDYTRLMELGWPWRVATYIAWSSSPKKDRKPASLQALATEVLGLTGPRQIYNWRKKYAGIDATVAMLQAASLWDHRRDVLEALVDSASDPDYKHHPDRKLYLEMTGDYIPRSQLDIGRKASGDVAELSDAELEAIVGDLTPRPPLRNGEGEQEGEEKESLPRIVAKPSSINWAGEAVKHGILHLPESDSEEELNNVPQDEAEADTEEDVDDYLDYLEDPSDGD
jgi:hypothetical protein